MFYYPKSFTLKSLLTSREVFTNVPRFALHFIRENKRTILSCGIGIPYPAASTIRNNISLAAYATASDNLHI